MADTLRRQCVLGLHYELTSDIFRRCNSLHSSTQSMSRAAFVLVCFDSGNMNGLFVTWLFFFFFLHAAPFSSVVTVSTNTSCHHDCSLNFSAWSLTMKCLQFGKVVFDRVRHLIDSKRVNWHTDLINYSNMLVSVWMSLHQISVCICMSVQFSVYCNLFLSKLLLVKCTCAIFLFDK